MLACEQCGMEVSADAALVLTFMDREATACSVQCAVAAVGLQCLHCGAPVLGQPTTGQDGEVFCSARCANALAVGAADPRLTSP